MSDAGRLWFYLCGDVQHGPVSDEVLRHKLRDSQLDPGTLVWTDSMPEWQPAAVALPAHSSAIQQDSASGDAFGTTPALTESEPLYFAVSTLKFAVMSITTAGLYDLYWAYRNWRVIKEHHGRNISPFWRAWFVVLFLYDLLRQVKTDLGARVPVDYRAGWLTIAYIALLLSWRLPDPFSYIGILGFVPLLPVVSAINRANRDRVAPNQMNTRFTGWNIAWLMVFGVLQVANIVLWLNPDLVPS